MPTVSNQPMELRPEVISHFGEWLKNERVKRGWSQERLGIHVDLSKAQVSRIESGEQSTKRTTAVRIAQEIGADVNDALNALFKDTEGSTGNLRRDSLIDLNEIEGYEELDADHRLHVTEVVTLVVGVVRSLQVKRDANLPHDARRIAQAERDASEMFGQADEHNGGVGERETRPGEDNNPRFSDLLARQRYAC